VLLSPLTTQEAALSSRIDGTQASLEEALEFKAFPREDLEAEKYSDIQEFTHCLAAIRNGSSAST
jgi:hypothetical protein